MSEASLLPFDIVKAVLAAAESGDVEGYISNYHESAVMRLRDGTVLSGKQSIKDRFTAFLGSGSTRQVTIHDEFTIFGDDVALVCASYTMRMTTGETTEEIRGSSHDVFTRDAEGKWLISIDHPYGQW